MVLGVGDRVDRYVIEGLLGSGGMGEVYRARDVRLQRSVALKIVKSEEDASATPTPDSPGAARMLREARAGAALRHANVVAVFDVGEIEEPEALRGTTFLAMELIVGKPLRQYVGDPSVPMAQRMRWLEGIAGALSAAHAAGLIHRDIKPENVMIDEDGTVKVLDFGVAKRTRPPIDPTSTTESLRLPSVATWNSAVGTPAYMSPEQLRNEPIDGRADQFAWGVTAYELLCGERPWTAKGNVLELVSNLLSVPPVPLSRRCSEVPAAVGAVVERALAKARGDRFASMEDLLAALRDPTRRKRRSAVLVALIAAAVAAPVALASLRTGASGGGAAAPTVQGASAPGSSALTATGTVPAAASFSPVASGGPTADQDPHGAPAATPSRIIAVRVGAAPSTAGAVVPAAASAATGAVTVPTAASSTAPVPRPIAPSAAPTTSSEPTTDPLDRRR